MQLRALVVVLLLGRGVHADNNAVTGFVATGSGELSGHAVDADGKPLRGVEVHVVSKTGGEQIVKTDKDGNYTVVLKGAPTETSMIFVRGHPGAHIGGVAAEPIKYEGGEAIDIHETLPPAVVAKPVSSQIAIPDYTEAAKTAGVWTRAWMMLDIDQTGTVRHIKVLKRPGYGLDEIAVRDAFALRFEPARDRANQPVASMLMWTYEWPSYSWLIEHNQGIKRLPADYLKVPCQKPGEHRVDVRDCAQPDVTAALDQAWLSPKPPPKR